MCEASESQPANSIKIVQAIILETHNLTEMLKHFAGVPVRIMACNIYIFSYCITYTSG